jgi:hypothetical protein
MFHAAGGLPPRLAEEAEGTAMMLTGPVGGIESGEHGFVVVAVEDEVGAFVVQHRLQLGRVHQRLALLGLAGQWRVMDQQDAEQPALAQIAQDAAQRLDLGHAEPARGDAPPHRHRARGPDQRHVSALAHEGKGGGEPGDVVGAGDAHVAGHVVGPQPQPRVPGGRHIGVVIARHKGDPFGIAEGFEPLRGRPVFGPQRQVDQVAGQRDVVRPVRHEVGDQRLEDLRPVDVAPAVLPGMIADEALAPQLGRAHPGQRRKVDVGEVSQREHAEDDQD